jgi:hypothetical protein
MTNFIDTDAGQAFISTADSRETSPEVMKAIAFFARTQTEAVAIWEGETINDSIDLTGIWEIATGNGRIDDADLYWGGRSLAKIMRENA